MTLPRAVTLTIRLSLFIENPLTTLLQSHSGTVVLWTVQGTLHSTQHREGSALSKILLNSAHATIHYLQFQQPKPRLHQRDGMCIL